jgi:hypothetical protein
VRERLGQPVRLLRWDGLVGYAGWNDLASPR